MSDKPMTFEEARQEVQLYLQDLPESRLEGLFDRLHEMQTAHAIEVAEAEARAWRKAKIIVVSDEHPESLFDLHAESAERRAKEGSDGE